MAVDPDWLALDAAHVWHPYSQRRAAPSPLPVVAARGAWLELADGRRILDGISSWWVNLHGHSHPRLNGAIARQVERLSQVIYAGFAHEPGARLAARLAEVAPGRLPRVFYSDDGSTAVEVAMKMAVQHFRQSAARRGPARSLFVALEGAYHGDTFGAMAAGDAEVFHGAFAELLCEVRHAPVPRPGVRSTAEALAALDRLLERDGERVAAVLVEPIVQGAGGMRIHPPEFLAGVAARTRAAGALLVADEIFTGFGRTGRLFACEHAGVEPDLLCLSKGLTGGYLPLSATLATEAVHATFDTEDRARTFFHGHSYTGNALACAVALESLAVFEEERALERVARLAALFAERLAGLARLEGVAGVRGIGGLAVVELARAGAGGYLDPRGPRLQRALLGRGVLLRPLGDVVYFLPPYCVTDEECHFVFDALAEELAALAP